MIDRDEIVLLDSVAAHLRCTQPPASTPGEYIPAQYLQKMPLILARNCGILLFTGLTRYSLAPTTTVPALAPLASVLSLNLKYSTRSRSHPGCLWQKG